MVFAYFLVRTGRLSPVAPIYISSPQRLQPVTNAPGPRISEPRSRSVSVAYIRKRFAPFPFTDPTRIGHRRKILISRLAPFEGALTPFAFREGRSIIPFAVYHFRVLIESFVFASLFWTVWEMGWPVYHGVWSENNCGSCVICFVPRLFARLDTWDRGKGTIIIMLREGVKEPGNLWNYETSRTNKWSGENLRAKKYARDIALTLK